MNRKHSDLTGQRFGKLLVLNFSHQIKSKCPKLKTVERWNCLCDCGKEKTTSSSCLIAGSTTHCGCLNAASFYNLTIKNKSREQSGYREVLSKYKHRATKSGKVYSLTYEDGLNLLLKNCFYCGKAPSNVKKTRFGEYIYSGLDRIDNNLGYFVENCNSCCAHCNFAKQALSLNDFNYAIKLLYLNFYLKDKLQIPANYMDNLEYSPLLQDKKQLSGLKYCYRYYKADAKRLRRAFKISFDSAIKLYLNSCYYCEGSPIYKSNYAGDYYHNGIDRVDTSRGYEDDNVVTCCSTCNNFKSDLSVLEFKNWVKDVYTNLNA